MLRLLLQEGTERGTGRSTERGTGRSTERGTGRSTERSTERGTGRKVSRRGVQKKHTGNKRSWEHEKLGLRGGKKGGALSSWDSGYWRGY